MKSLLSLSPWFYKLCGQFYIVKVYFKSDVSSMYIVAQKKPLHDFHHVTVNFLLVHCIWH